MSEIISDVNLRKRKGRTEEQNYSTENVAPDKQKYVVGNSRILYDLIVFRLCNVFLVQTWFVPDEFWQGPEVAHRIAFGYGHLTWEWREGIRGYTYPLLFAILYQLLRVFHIDFPEMIILLPRFLQAIFGAFGEYYLYKFAGLLYGANVAWWVLFCQVTSWFMFFCITRTLTNTMETALISVALYYLQLSESNKQLNHLQKSATYKALFLAAFSCLVRPTALIVWIPLGIVQLWQSKSMAQTLAMTFAPVAVGALTFSVVVDSCFHGELVLAQYNFLHFNVVQNIGNLYGTHQCQG